MKLATLKIPKSKCDACGLPHWSATKRGVCLACSYFDLVRGEKAKLADVIRFLINQSLCAYCGEYGSEIEHVVPRCSGLPTYTLLACQECNLIASGHLFGSFDQKQQFIVAQIKRKYSKLLNQKEWDEEELEEMSYKMQKMIMAYQIAAHWTKRRTEWSLWSAFALAEKDN